MDKEQLQRMDNIATTMAETESLWLTICNTCEDVRVEMLIDALIEQHGLVMEGETNANAVMALVGFLARQVMALHDDGDVTVESAMVLLQIGMQRGVQAHLAIQSKKGSS